MSFILRKKILKTKNYTLIIRYAKIIFLQTTLITYRPNMKLIPNPVKCMQCSLLIEMLHFLTLGLSTVEN